MRWPSGCLLPFQNFVQPRVHEYRRKPLINSNNFSLGNRFAMQLSWILSFVSNSAHNLGFGFQLFGCWNTSGFFGNSWLRQDSEIHGEGLAQPQSLASRNFPCLTGMRHGKLADIARSHNPKKLDRLGLFYFLWRFYQLFSH